jgi:hypothetical protein
MGEVSWTLIRTWERWHSLQLHILRRSQRSHSSSPLCQLCFRYFTFLCVCFTTKCLLYNNPVSIEPSSCSLPSIVPVCPQSQLFHSRSETHPASLARLTSCSSCTLTRCPLRICRPYKKGASPFSFSTTSNALGTLRAPRVPNGPQESLSGPLPRSL